ncbi:MAG: gamma-glutamyltransferase family protein [Myxococcota bacterium]
MSAAAARLLRSGGNAFDASVAAGFASTVAEPVLTSLGGGGFLLAYESTGRVRLFDFFVNTPGCGREGAQRASHFVPVTVRFAASEQVFNVGRGSIAVPGTLCGLLHVHEKLGRRPLAEVLTPAIELAHDGVTVNAHQAYFLDILYPILRLGEESRHLFTRNGGPLRCGDRLRNPDLARFLEALPEDGGRRLYEGELASQLGRLLSRDGSLMTEDLARYRVVEREPLAFRYREHQVLGNPPPAFGGLLLCTSLARLARESLGSLGWGSARHLTLLIEGQREVDRLREEWGATAPTLSPDDLAGRSPPRRRARGGTTHLCVADAEGNVASMTASNGEGSSVVVPGAGIMLNNMLGEDDLHPEGFHAGTAGERIASMMSPSLVLRAGEPILALGSGGSKRIRSAILQVMTQVLDFGRELQVAVDAPRIHWDGETVQIEPGFPESAIAALERRWPVNRWSDREVYFGGVQAVQPGRCGAADPRRGGAVERVEL